MDSKQHMAILDMCDALHQGFALQCIFNILCKCFVHHMYLSTFTVQATMLIPTTNGTNTKNGKKCCNWQKCKFTSNVFSLIIELSFSLPVVFHQPLQAASHCTLEGSKGWHGVMGAIMAKCYNILWYSKLQTKKHIHA